MTRVNAEQQKYTPWFAKAGAACSIVPIARFVNERIFALKGGGYGCLFSLTGVDEEALTDQGLEAQVRSIEGALRGLPEGACLYQYTRVMSGFNLPKKAQYGNPVTQVFVNDRLAFLDKSAGFRRIDLHWCLTLEPPKAAAFKRKPKEHDTDTTRMLADLEKTATLANLIPCTMVFIAFIINMLFIPSMTQAIFGGTAGLADSVSKVGGAVASIAMMAG
jgi:type IV secretion system protein VirB4